MIEIIKETTKKTEDNIEVKLPKNIRQIGNPEKDFRIYMEDYVYTYLHPAQLPGVELGILPRLLILLGEIDHFSNRSCAFISGAIQVSNSDFSEEIPELNEETWREIHVQIRQYFEKCEIVGWVLDIPGNTLQITEEIEQIHRKNFIGTYQFFFLMDSKEREEAFYTWKQGKLTRKEGYFIYYEKNPQMQEYMINQREKKFGKKVPPEVVQDRATQNYRALMLEKKEQTSRRGTGILSFLTSLLMVITLCAVSVILVGSIQRMNKMEETIEVMSVTTETEKKQIAVETVSGNVISLKEKEEIAAANAVEAVSAEIPVNPDVNAEKVTEQPASQKPEAAPAAAPVANTEIANISTSVPETTDYKSQGYYIVQQGDNLQQICYKIYQTDAVLDKLCEVNAITDKDAIFAGQKLTLP